MRLVEPYGQPAASGVGTEASPRHHLIVGLYFERTVDRDVFQIGFSVSTISSDACLTFYLGQNRIMKENFALT